MVLTHLKGGTQILHFYKRLFHSNFRSKSRCDAILVDTSTPFVASEVIADPKGRYVIVTGKLFSTPLVLASVYAPNWNDKFHFFLFVCYTQFRFSFVDFRGGVSTVKCSQFLTSSQTITVPSKICPTYSSLSSAICYV